MGKACSSPLAEIWLCCRRPSRKGGAHEESSSAEARSRFRVKGFSLRIGVSGKTIQLHVQLQEVKRSATLLAGAAFHSCFGFRGLALLVVLHPLPVFRVHQWHFKGYLCTRVHYGCNGAL